MDHLSIALPAVLQAVTGMLVCLGLRRMNSSRRSLEELRDGLDKLSKIMEGIRANSAERPAKADTHFDAPPARPAEPGAKTGIHLTERSRALLLHSQGLTAVQIAAVTGTPRNEVELLLKVHRLTS